MDPAKLAGWFFGFAGLVVLAAFFTSEMRMFQEPFEHHYAEGIILYQILHALPLSDAYRPITFYPHIVFHYTPLYHILLKLTGLSVSGTLYAARLVSLISAITVAVCCAALLFLTRPSGARKPVLYGTAIIVAAFALHTESFGTTAVAVRSDTLGVAFAILGLYLFVKSGTRGIPLWIPLSLFLAAVYCKQTLIGAPAACLAALWLMDRRTCARAFAFLAVTGALILDVMEWSTNGQFVRHIFLYNVNPFSAVRAAEGIANHIALSLPVFVCGLLTLTRFSNLCLRHRARIGVLLTSSVRARALFCTSMFATAGMVLSISIGKAGGAPNYFLEWDASFAVLAGAFLIAQFSSRGATRFNSRQLAAGALSLVWLLQAAPFVYRSFIPSQFMKQRTAMKIRSYGQLVPWIRNQRNLVLSEDMTLLVLAGRPVPMEPAIFYALSTEGVWDEKPFVERIRRGEFAAVILIHSPDDIFTRGVADALRSAYHESAPVGDYRIYLPNRGS